MTCEKKAFLTKQDAILKIAEIQNEHGDNKKPIRSYKCPECKMFHLTSMTKRKHDGIVNGWKNRMAKRVEAISEYWLNKKKWAE